MKKIYSLLLAVAFAAASALAEPVKLKVSAVLDLHAGLSALDGYQKEIPQGRDPQTGADRPSLVMPVGYKFSAETKWAIVADLAAAKKVKDVYDAAVLGVVKAVSPDGTGETIDKSPALKARFSDEVRKLQEHEETVDLRLIAGPDLNLDVNQNIPGTVLTWLAPAIRKP